MQQERDFIPFEEYPRTALYSVIILKGINSKIQRDLRLTRFGMEIVKNSDVLELYHSYNFISCINVTDAEEGLVKLLFIDETRLKFYCENYKELILSLNEMLAYHRTLKSINRFPNPYPEGKPVKMDQMPYSMEMLLNDDVLNNYGDSYTTAKKDYLLHDLKSLNLKNSNELRKNSMKSATFDDLIFDCSGISMSNKVTEPVYREFLDLISTTYLNEKIRLFGKKLKSELRKKKYPLSQNEASVTFLKLSESISEFRNNTRIELIEKFKGDVKMVYTPAEIRYEVTQGELAPGGGTGAGDRDLLFIIGECIDYILFPIFSTELLSLINSFTAKKRQEMETSIRNIWNKVLNIVKKQLEEIKIPYDEDDIEIDSEDKMREKMEEFIKTRKITNINVIESNEEVQNYLFDIFGVDKKLRQKYPKSIAALQTICSFYELTSIQTTVCELVRAISIIYEEGKAGSVGSKGINGADDLIGVLTYCLFMSNGIKSVVLQSFIGTNSLSISNNNSANNTNSVGTASNIGKGKITRNVSLRDSLTKNDEGAYYSIILETGINAILDIGKD